MQKRLIIFLTFFLFVTTVKAQKPKETIKKSDIVNIQLLPVVSFINLIESKNKPTYNDSLSKASAELVKETLLGNKEIPITDSLIVLNKIKYENEVESLILSILKKKTANGITLTPIIDSLISISGKRFGIIALSTGFSRGKGNYGKEIAKSVGVGILTLGMYTQVPYIASSNLYVMIVDSQNNNIAFYNRSNFIDKEPLNKKVISKQFQRIFKGFYDIVND